MAADVARLRATVEHLEADWRAEQAGAVGAVRIDRVQPVGTRLGPGQVAAIGRRAGIHELPEDLRCDRHVRVALDVQRAVGALSADSVVVAYCRGPYCVYADDAVREILRKLYNGKQDPVQAMFLKDLFELLEKGTDRCRDAGAGRVWLTAAAEGGI